MCTFTTKVLFQEACAAKIYRDIEFEGDVRRRNFSFVNEIERSQRVSIPRYTFHCAREVSEVQIHAFSDANEKAYTTAVYLRTIDRSGEVSVKVMMSKAKVVPLLRF